MGRNRIGVLVVALAMTLSVGGCAADAAPEESGSASPRPTVSRTPSPSPTPSPTSSTPVETDAGEDGHDDGEHVTHPPADPSLTATTAYASCVAAGKASSFTDDPDATWEPFESSYVQRVDGVWRVHSGVTTTSAESGGSGTSAYCQVSGSESAPVILTVGVTLAGPDDPALWALPEG